MAFPVKYIHCPLKSNKKVSLRDILLIHLCILLHAHIEAVDYIFLVGLFCRNLSCDSLTLKPDGGFDPWSNHLMTCNIVDVPFSLYVTLKRVAWWKNIKYYLDIIPEDSRFLPLFCYNYSIPRFWPISNVTVFVGLNPSLTQKVTRRWQENRDWKICPVQFKCKLQYKLSSYCCQWSPVSQKKREVHLKLMYTFGPFE